VGLLAAIALGACTPGAVVPAGGSAGTTIDVNLTLHPQSATPYGTSGGYAPAVTTVAVGTSVRFVNSDGFAHTATSLGTAGFPAGSPFGSPALQQSGATLSSGWTSGALAAGTGSQALLADAPGTYFYGCFFHYGAPMRAAIVVR
jgi:plastocyanin